MQSSRCVVVILLFVTGHLAKFPCAGMAILMYLLIYVHTVLQSRNYDQNQIQSANLDKFVVP